MIEGLEIVSVFTYFRSIGDSTTEKGKFSKIISSINENILISPLLMPHIAYTYENIIKKKKNRN